MTASAHSRLNERSLGLLAPGVRRPAYDRSKVSEGVVHLGIGAFHRAHQAAVFDDLIAHGDPRWGVLGVSLRSADVSERLNPQDGLYNVSVRDGQQVADRIIGSVRRVIVARDAPQAVLGAIAAPETHLVTLTVTEKGYHLDPASGELNLDDPAIRLDLAASVAPTTPIGLIVMGLKLRRERTGAPVTVMSCDNLSRNGARLRNAVKRFAEAVDPSLTEWIDANVAFPETMVDRIVPATDPGDIAAFAERSRVLDQGFVKTEPFWQWVVEDRFAGERPDLAAAGVQITQAVAPWETAKLRLLNGAHSAIAYLGGLAGVDFVHEFISAPGGRAYIEGLWDEAASTLTSAPDIDVAAYRAQLLSRFKNSALQHRTRQIAMDGSQKLPPRLLASATARLSRGQRIDHLALAIAAWMRWVGGADDTGRPTQLDDPMAASLKATAMGAASPEHQVRALLAIERIFPADLAAHPVLVDALVRQLKRLAAQGAAAAWSNPGL